MSRTLGDAATPFHILFVLELTARHADDSHSTKVRDGFRTEGYHSLSMIHSRTPDTEALPIAVPAPSSPQSTAPWPNLAGKQLSQSYNSNSSGKSSLTVAQSSQENSRVPLNKTARYNR